MLDYLLVKQNNYILVVVHRGSQSLPRLQLMCEIQVCGTHVAFTFTEMMFGMKIFFFFQTTNQSRRRTDSLGKSSKGQKF